MQVGSFDIPYEIWQKISHYIPARDVLSLTTICRAMHDGYSILQEGNEEAFILTALRANTLALASISPFFPVNIMKIKCLDLSEVKNENLPPESLQTLQEMVPHLTALKCKKIVLLEGHFKQFSRWTNLQSLTLNGCKVDEEADPGILGLCTKLQSLSLSETKNILPLPLDRLPKLVEFNFWAGYDFSVDVIVKTLPQHITKLALPFSELSDETMELFSRFTHLQDLDISWNGAVSGKKFYELPHSLERLMAVGCRIKKKYLTQLENFEHLQSFRYKLKGKSVGIGLGCQIL